MAGARVLGGRDGLRVEGRGHLYAGVDHDLVAALEVVGPASLASLRQGLRRWSSGGFKFVRLGIIEEPAAKVEADPEKFWPQPVEIRLAEFGADVGTADEYYVFAASYGDPDEGLPNTQQVASLIDPFLRRSKATAEIAIDDDETDYGGLYQLGISIRLPIKGRTVADAYRIGKGALALLEAADGGSLRLETTLDLLRSGRVDVLLGQKEDDWIDFKRKAYEKTEHGKLELAKDVAAFANADGGLLLLGVAAVKTGHVETASAIIPCTPGSVSTQSYRAIIRRRVHPPPERLEIFAIPQDEQGDVWVLSVPPQPEEFKPFLVHGAVVNNKVNDAYYSIVVRRDDDNVPTDPQAVHALLSAGRAALRGRSSG